MNDEPAYTQRGRDLLARAEVEARLLGHGHLGTEHLLSALLAVGGIGIAVLRRLGVPVEPLRQSLSRPPSPEPAIMAWTPRARKALAFAEKEHGIVGTGEILLGLLREADGDAADLLTRHVDASLYSVRRAVEEEREWLDDDGPAEGPRAGLGDKGTPWSAWSQGMAAGAMIGLFVGVPVAAAVLFLLPVEFFVWPSLLASGAVVVAVGSGALLAHWIHELRRKPPEARSRMRRRAAAGLFLGVVGGLMVAATLLRWQGQLTNVEKVVGLLAGLIASVFLGALVTMIDPDPPDYGTSGKLNYLFGAPGRKEPGQAGPRDGLSGKPPEKREEGP